MTEQMSLFDKIPASRLYDGLPSILAEDNLNESGGMARQRQQAYMAVKEHSGMTALELATITGLCRFMLSRRLPELCKLNLVKRGELRKCTINGHLMGTWEAVK
jgi:hypothetical protein